MRRFNRRVDVLAALLALPFAIGPAIALEERIRPLDDDRSKPTAFRPSYRPRKVRREPFGVVCTASRFTGRHWEVVAQW